MGVLMLVLGLGFGLGLWFWLGLWLGLGLGLLFHTYIRVCILGLLLMEAMLPCVL